MMNRALRGPRLVLILAWLMGLTAHWSTFAHAADKPNFVVILSDDQSWVGSSLEMIPGDARTRSDYFRTPNIERLAQMGMRFTQGYTPAASCCPTRRSLQTGQMPARHEYNGDRDGWTETYKQQLNIPRMLKRADPSYVTAHFGKWDHRYDEIAPADQGYDFSDGYTGNADGGAKGSGGPAATQDPKRIDTITGEALQFLDRQHAADRPFYLQISHYAVHLDIYYNASTLADVRKNLSPGKKHNMPEFAAMTADMDAGVGRILDKLLELDLLENTYLIFMSDNGGRTSIPGAPASDLNRNTPLRDGKHSFYEGGIRVPFIVLGPDIKPNSVCRVPVNGVDLFPTFADLAGYPGPLPRNIDGGSFRQLLQNEGRGTVERPNPFLVYHQAVDRKPITAIRMGDFKLVKTWDQDRLELFDISRDLSEVDDLSGRMLEKTQELHALLTTYLEEVGADIPSSDRKSKRGKKSSMRAPSDATRDMRKALIPAGTRPNVLFLAIDDLNDWEGSPGGHPQARTPNLDRLISQRVLFRNAHCAAPVCGASRHALLSGLRPSTTGWYSNASKSLESYQQTLGDTVPLPTHFKHNGYTTLAAGKIFHKGTHDVAGYDYWDEERPKYKWPAELAERGHGYQGGGGHFYPFPRDGGAIYQKYQAGVDGQSLCWGALEEADVPPEGMPDEQVAAWAVERLERKYDRPFFLATKIPAAPRRRRSRLAGAHSADFY